MELFLKQDTKVAPKTLRCADLKGENLIIGSFDKKVYLYKKIGKSFEFIQNYDCFDATIYSIRFASNDTFFVGLMNGAIYWMNLQGELIHLFSEQKNITCSIDCYQDFMVSGHWAGICAVWSLKTNTLVKLLPDHVHGVTVKFLPSGELITGSQNGVLHIWAKNTFEKIKSAEAHTNIIRDIRCDSQYLYTCSNDHSVSVWTHSLVNLSSVKLHTSFVYTVASWYAIDGKITLYSAGEDFKIRISQNGKEMGEIGYPSTIWSLIANPINNELIAIGEDGSMRVFTFDKSELEDIEKHYEFTQASEMAMLKNPEVDEKDLAKFPSIDKLSSTIGKKEGEIKVFIKNGKGEAYMWQKEKWVFIGEMVGTNPTMGARVYEGDKYFPKGNYDFIFDIQDDTGVPRLLPFNKTDNVLVSTEKFIAREQLSVSFKEQIMNFVIKNSKLSAPVVEQKTSQNDPSSFKKRLTNFPIVDYVYFTVFNKSAALAKIKEINASFEGKEEFAQKMLSKLEMAIFEKFLEKIENHNNEHESTIEESETKILEQKLIKWTDENGLAIVDVLRMYLLHHDSTRLLNGVDSGVKFIVFVISFSKFDQEKYLLLILRFLCNLFKENPRSLLKCDEILKDFLNIKGSTFTPKAISIMFVLISNLISSLIENQIDYDFSYLIRFLSERDLSYVLASKVESVDFCIAIGNALSSQKEEVKEIVLKSSLKSIILQVNQDTNGLIEDIKQYLLI